MREKRQCWILGFLLLIFAWTSSCGEPIPVDCATEEECTTENEGGFQTGTVAGSAAGGAAALALAGGAISGGEESGSNNDAGVTVGGNTDGNSGSGSGGSTTGGDASETTSTLFSRVNTEILQAKCITCHVAGGLAQNTSLRYVSTFLSNYEALELKGLFSLWIH